MRGREQSLPGGDHADAVQELGRTAVLEQETAGAGLQTLEHVRVGVVRGQDENAYPRQVVRAGDRPGGLDAVHLRHPDVHEHDVRAGGAGLRHGFGAGGGFPDHRDVVLQVEQQPEAGPHQLLVVDEKHPDRSVTAHPFVVPAGARGSRAVTVKPPPVRGPASNSPPSS